MRKTKAIVAAVMVALALVAAPMEATAQPANGTQAASNSRSASVVYYRLNARTMQAQVVGSRGRSIRIPWGVRYRGRTYRVVSVSAGRLGRDLKSIRLEAPVRNRALRRYAVSTPHASVYDYMHNCGGPYPARVVLAR